MKKELKIVIIISVMILIGITTILFKMINNNIKYTKFEQKNNQILTHKKPEGFKKGYTDGAYSSYSYYGDDISCYYSIDTEENYTQAIDGKDYLERNFHYTMKDKVGEIKEKVIDGITWYSVKKESNDGTTLYNYVTMKDENVYKFEYTIHDYNNGDYGEGEGIFCYKALEEIVHSLKIK